MIRHPHQQDNLQVFIGRRTSILRKLGDSIDKSADFFEVTPTTCKHNGEMIWNAGPFVLRWEKNVWHQVNSGEDGSTSINFAVRYEGFTFEHEFDIWKLNESDGTHEVIRVGKDDQM
jgi:hypothetical protein